MEGSRSTESRVVRRWVAQSHSWVLLTILGGMIELPFYTKSLDGLRRRNEKLGKFTVLSSYDEFRDKDAMERFEQLGVGPFGLRYYLTEFIQPSLRLLASTGLL